MLYKITALVLAVLVAIGVGGFAVQTQRLGKAENRAVEATKLAGEYQRSLESLERAVAAQAKSDKAARESLENRAKVAEQLAAKTKKENHALQEALAGSPDWAGQPVPDRVRTAIRN